MKLMILCGGRGRRLGEVTANVPKPLVPFGGSTILDYKLRDYLRRGFRDFIMCLGYRGDLIREAVAPYRSEANFEFSDAGEEAGLLKRMWCARELVSDRVILTYGDTFTDLDFSELERVHAGSSFDATIVTAPIQSPLGLVEFDENRRVTAFREKPVLAYYIGQAVLERRVLDDAPGELVSLADGLGLVRLFDDLRSRGKLGAYHYSGLELTFNTREELDLAQEKLLRFYTEVRNRKDA